jgi:ankyrin repeat protein
MNRKLLSSSRTASLGALWLCWGQSAPAEWQKRGSTWYQDGQIVSSFPIFGQEARPVAIVQIEIGVGEYALYSDQFIPQADAFRRLTEEVRQFLSRLGFAFVEGDHLRVQRTFVITEVVHRPDTIAQGMTETTWHWQGLSAGVAAIRFFPKEPNRFPRSSYLVQFKNLADLTGNADALRVASLPNQFFKRDLSWSPSNGDCWTVRIDGRWDQYFFEFSVFTMLADKLHVTVEHIPPQDYKIQSGVDIDGVLYFSHAMMPGVQPETAWWRSWDPRSKEYRFTCKGVPVFVPKRINDLQRSVVAGDLEWMKELLNDRVDATVKTTVVVMVRVYCLPLLHLAALLEYTELVRELVRRYPDMLLSREDTDLSPLEFVVAFGDVKMRNGENEILSLLATQKVLDRYGARVLSQCAQQERPDVAGYIFGRMSLDQVRAKDEKDRPLLHQIIAGCSRDDDGDCAAVLKALFIENTEDLLGADKVRILRELLEELDSEGYTPLHRAVLAKMPLTYDELMGLSAPSLLTTTGDGRTLLHLAAEKKDFELLQKLSQVPAFADNPNATDHRGRTALHCAVDSERGEIVEQFLELFPKTDMNVRDVNGHTPLYYAVRQLMCKEVLEALLKKEWNEENPDLVQRRIKVFSHIFGWVNHNPAAGAALLAEESGVALSSPSDNVEIRSKKGAGHFLVHCSDVGLEVFDIWADHLFISTATCYESGFLPILFARDREGRTAWDLAIELGHHNFLMALNDLLIHPKRAEPGVCGRTMLHWVSELGIHTAVLPLLACRTPEQVSQKDRNGKTAWDLAAEKGHNEIVQAIDGFVPDQYGMLLRREAELGHLNTVLQLLARRTSEQVLPSNEDIRVVRDLAETKGHNNVVQAIDAFTQHGSALVAAVRADQVPVVAQLLQLLWVEVNAKDKTGLTALYHAVTAKNAPCVCALLRNPEIDVNIQNGSANNTALFVACWRGYAPIVKLLLGHPKIDVNAQSQSTRRTALHQAASSSKIDCVRLLLANNKINVNQLSSGGWTALGLAVQKGNVEIVKLLLQKKTAEREAAVSMEDARRVYGTFQGSTDVRVQAAVRLVKNFIDSGAGDRLRKRVAAAQVMLAIPSEKTLSGARH